MKIIIPSYNRPLKLKRTLTFYKSVSFDNDPEIVVLDGSDDGVSSKKIKEICESLGVIYIFRQVTFIEFKGGKLLVILQKLKSGAPLRLLLSSLL